MHTRGNRCRRQLRKDTTVNTGTRLALNATLLALGLSLSAAQALADDVAEPTTATESTSPDQHSRENAKAANEAAVNEAVTAVIEATRLELDVRLIGPTSITVAAGN